IWPGVTVVGEVVSWWSSGVIVVVAVGAGGGGTDSLTGAAGAGVGGGEGVGVGMGGVGGAGEGEWSDIAGEELDMLRLGGLRWWGPEKKERLNCRDGVDV